MKRLPTINDFSKIVIEDIPLIDVRAPVEFKAGAFPTAVNLPLMDDKDRHLVGICYKQKGREAAFDLAEKRVSGAIKEERIAAWLDFYRNNPTALLYCFRGGMRSKTAQQWLCEHSGLTLERLQGGYKAFRRFLIEALDPAKVAGLPVILGGRTGTGKTILLRQLADGIDLEALANHRGSAFGGFLSPQPSQIDFENRLAFALIKHGHKNFKYIVLEDEGSYIGGCYIPHELARYFKRDSMVLLECDLDKRIAITWQEYVVDAQQQFRSFYGEETGLTLWVEHIQSRMQRIHKRLGGERLKRVLNLLDAGRKEQLASGDPGGHRPWIELLLSEYYDPMYDYQIEKSGRKIVFKGNFNEVLDYLHGLEEEIPLPPLKD
jgi:tRNA 2-selenouridine synthase